jgi:hypothetical protein
MRRKSLLVAAGCCAAVVCLLAGIQRDRRNPNQHVNQYWAVRQFDAWRFFGREIYARNELAVYDMTGRATAGLPEPLNTRTVQIRRFGKIVQGDSQFNLGEDGYQKDQCIGYIEGVLETKGIRH